MEVINLSEKELRNAWANRKIRICVIGLGRIGLPTACMFAASCGNVIGADINEAVVNDVNSAVCRFQDEPELGDLLKHVINEKKLEASSDVSSSVAQADVIIVCVPTPVNTSKVPNFNAILAASTQIAKSLKKGALIVIESTVSPGTVENKIIPLVEQQSKMNVGKDFGIVSCPERASPGETLRHLKSLPRVVGGINSKIADVASKLYHFALGVEIINVANPKTANAVKLTENIFRDVNIALMNEFAILYEKLGIDALEVIKTCASKYNFVPHFPGAGVGGPCLPANAYYIIDEGMKVGYIPYMIRMAREINDRMPSHVVNLVTETLNNAGKVVNKSKIALLGVSYKADVHDLQMTPFERVYQELSDLGACITIYDPMFKGEDVFGTIVAKNLDDALSMADCVIIGTAHKEFQNLDFEKVTELCKKPTAFVDTQNVIAPEVAKKYGFSYLGVGRRGISF